MALRQNTPISSDVSGARIFAPSTRREHGSVHNKLGWMTKDHARRAGASSTINPTRRLGGPFFSWSRTFSEPMKPPSARRSFPITQERPASMGVVLSSRSFPYRHIPASSRSESRAPRPASWTGGRRSTDARKATWAGGTEI
jgi:hypothetical protein